MDLNLISAIFWILSFGPLYHFREDTSSHDCAQISYFYWSNSTVESVGPNRGNRGTDLRFPTLNMELLVYLAQPPKFNQQQIRISSSEAATATTAAVPDGTATTSPLDAENIPPMPANTVPPQKVRFNHT